MSTENTIPIQTKKNTASSENNQAIDKKDNNQKDIFTQNEESLETLSEQIDVYDVFSHEYIDKIKLELMAEISLRLPRDERQDQDLFREAEELLQDVRLHAQDIQPEESQEIQAETVSDIQSVIQENIQPECRAAAVEVHENIQSGSQAAVDEAYENIQSEPQPTAADIQEAAQSETEAVLSEISKDDPSDLQDDSKEIAESETNLVSESPKEDWPIESIKPQEEKMPIPVPEVEAPYDFDFVW